MTIRKRRWTRSTGVTLEVPVLNYLQAVAEKEDRDRSLCINCIVREHAAAHGCPLPPATLAPAESSAPLVKEN